MPTKEFANTNVTATHAVNGIIYLFILYSSREDPLRPKSLFQGGPTSTHKADKYTNINAVIHITITSIHI